MSWWAVGAAGLCQWESRSPQKWLPFSSLWGFFCLFF